ncbi:hypothetical protein Vretimale_7589 [Volvox reticuliferus]|uniref:Uncharacterized protein n=1 Tax=Volvox reticuliferus TaxID=1737510 RepID=A0A8J4G9L4_9CHLO|nr:hypothetical protein Vretifemale_7647 [Volvox reticuliferus]GIM02732.1 hypothetical protein Vretimale_7589 [Volvox reticuliferus]
MGCGASKGTETVASQAAPNIGDSKPEFTPETKPRPSTNPAELTKSKESGDSPAKRVEAIVKSGVSDFDDDTETTLVRPLTAEEPSSVQPLPATVLPPPPVTPPAAAKKPLFQAADTSTLDDAPPEDGVEASYFPTQVSLSVGAGGGGGSYHVQQHQQQPQRQPESQTSLQAFGTSVRPSVPELESAPVSGGGATMTLATPALLPVNSSRQLQQLPSLPQQRQLQPLQQQSPTRALPPVQGQGQPLTESGPGPTTSSSPPAQPAASTSTADDPWSSLQSTYRIRENQAAQKSESTRSRAATSSREAGREVLVLGDDDDDFGGNGGVLNSTANSAMNRTSGFGGRPPISLPPPQFGSGPKKGGWGSGAMAQAGELMLGEDDWLVNERPPGASSVGGMQVQPPALQRQQQQQQQAVLSYNSRAKIAVEEEDRHAPVKLKGPLPAPKTKAVDDVMCEDVEDVEALLEDEMERQGLSNKNLASKLAAYEAQFKDDDD